MIENTIFSEKAWGRGPTTNGSHEKTIHPLHTDLQALSNDAWLALFSKLLNTNDNFAKELSKRVHISLKGMDGDTLRPSLQKLSRLKRNGWFNAGKCAKIIKDLAEPVYSSDIHDPLNRVSARALIERVYATSVGLFDQVDDSSARIQSAIRYIQYLADGLILFDYDDSKEREATLKLLLKTAGKKQLVHWPDYAVNLLRPAMYMVKSDKEEKLWKKAVEAFSDVHDKDSYYANVAVALSEAMRNLRHGKQ